MGAASFAIKAIIGVVALVVVLVVIGWLAKHAISRRLHRRKEPQLETGTQPWSLQHPPGQRPLQYGQQPPHYPEQGQGSGLPTYYAQMAHEIEHQRLSKNNAVEVVERGVQK